MTSDSQMFAGSLTTVYDDTSEHSVGDVTREGQNVYIFAKGVASTAVGSWVSFDEELQSSLLVANAKGRVGIAKAAIVAGKYGWYQIEGKNTEALALTGFADNGNIYATATAGSVDDTVVVGDYIVGAVGRSAVSGGVITVELNRPMATDLLS